MATFWLRDCVGPPILATATTLSNFHTLESQDLLRRSFHSFKQFTRSVVLAASQVVVFVVVNFARCKVKVGVKSMAKVVKLPARPLEVFVQPITQNFVFGRQSLHSEPLSVVFSQEQSANSNLFFTVNLAYVIEGQLTIRFPQV